MMMNKKPLTDFEQKCYDFFTEGLTAYQIAQKLQIAQDLVTDARYCILTKGYDPPKLVVPSSELPRCADEIVSARRKPKEERERMRAPKKELTEEERQEIIEESRSGMRQKEIAEKHGIPQSGVSRIVNSSGDKPEPKEVQYPPIPHGQEVIAILDDGSYALVTNDFDGFADNHNHYSADEVRAWMPKPEPPEEV